MAELPVGGEARGLAGVFGSSINPLATYMSYATQRQRNKAAMAAQQKADRDKTMDYMDKFNPQSKFSELNYKINEAAQQNVRSWMVGEMDRGRQLSQIMPEAQFRKGQITSLVGESDAWKATLDGLQEQIDKDPIRYKTDGPESAKSLLRDIYMNTDGTVKDFDEIRAGIQDSDKLLYDPRALNTGGVVKSFVEKLPEQSRTLLSNRYSAMGYSPDEVETLSKSKLKYELDKNGQPLLDDDNLPKVIIDDHVYQMAKADPWMNSLMTAASPNRAGQIQWLKDNVRGQGDAVNVNRQVISGKNIKDQQRFKHFGGYGYRTPIEDLNNRDEMLNQISLGGTTGSTLLGYFDDPASDIKAQYSNVNADKKKGQFVKIDYTTSAIDMPTVSDEEYNNFTAAERRRYDDNLKNRKVVKSNYYDITTEDGRDKLKVALSTEMDRINKKTAIGEEYANFIREKRESKSKGKKGASTGKYNFDNAGQ